MNSVVEAGKRVRIAGVLVVALAVGGIPAALSQDWGDTPYVQTPQNVVDKMLEIAKVGPKDYVIDLGSGDGRMIITAAKRYGARGFGVDHDRRLVQLANRRAAQAGVADRAVFYERDLYKTDIRRATVVTIYLLPEVNLMVRSKLLSTLKPGTRVVSHDYDMGEWPPDLALVLDAPDKPVGRDFKSKVFYWVVPAAVSGKWRGELAGGSDNAVLELSLSQMFQQVDGKLVISGREAKIDEGRLNGEDIAIRASAREGESTVRYTLSGRVVKDRIEGKVRVTRNGEERQLAWKAARIESTQPAHLALKPPPPPANPW